MKSTDKWNTFYTSETRESFLHFSDEQLESILKQFPNAVSALDIGCGEGQLMTQLEVRSISTTGMDISDVALTEAHRHAKGVLIESDFEQYTFQKDVRFDLIFVKFVIAFIRDVGAFFKKIDTLLKPGGGLILLTPVTNGKRDPYFEGDDIFIQQSVLDTFMPLFFSKINEEVLHAEDDKKLALYICTKGG